MDVILYGNSIRAAYRMMTSHYTSKPSTFAQQVQMYFSSYSSTRFFSALRKDRDFIEKTYDYINAWLEGKHVFESGYGSTSGPHGKNVSYVIPMAKFQYGITHRSGHLETSF